MREERRKKREQGFVKIFEIVKIDKERAGKILKEISIHDEDIDVLSSYLKSEDHDQCRLAFEKLLFCRRLNMKDSMDFLDKPEFEVKAARNLMNKFGDNLEIEILEKFRKSEDALVKGDALGIILRRFPGRLSLEELKNFLKEPRCNSNFWTAARAIFRRSPEELGENLLFCLLRSGDENICNQVAKFLMRSRELPVNVLIELQACKDPTVRNRAYGIAHKIPAERLHEYTLFEALEKHEEGCKLTTELLLKIPIKKLSLIRLFHLHDKKFHIWDEHIGILAKKMANSIPAEELDLEELIYIIKSRAGERKLVESICRKIPEGKITLDILDHWGDGAYCGAIEILMLKIAPEKLEGENLKKFVHLSRDSRFYELIGNLLIRAHRPNLEVVFQYLELHYSEHYSGRVNTSSIMSLVWNLEVIPLETLMKFQSSENREFRSQVNFLLKKHFPKVRNKALKNFDILQHF